MLFCHGRRGPLESASRCYSRRELKIIFPSAGVSIRSRIDGSGYEYHTVTPLTFRYLRQNLKVLSFSGAITA